MSAPDDSYQTAPTWELIDDLLDNRPEVYQKAKEELLARLSNTKKEHVIELVAMETLDPLVEHGPDLTPSPSAAPSVQ